MSGGFAGLLAGIALPKVARVERALETRRLDDAQLAASLDAQLAASPAWAARVRPGARIAIAVGSRAIGGLVPAVRTVAARVRQAGGEPFIVPAMGSHGGATGPGQRAVLAHLGVTEDAVGAPVVSSMQVERIGATPDGRPVFVDAAAWGADGIVAVNRVKRHTSFRGRYESGLMKMLAIGLGKQEGARACHRSGFANMAASVEAVGGAVLATGKVVCGVALVDGARGDAAMVRVVDADDIPEVEPQLLQQANALCPELPWGSLDVLVLGCIGKEISGTGMDTNVVGRVPGHPQAGPGITRIGVLDLSDASLGNANGVGRADCISARLRSKMDLEQLYRNAITSTALESARIPLVAPDDRAVFQACIAGAGLLDPAAVRLAVVQHTKNLQVLYATQNLVGELSGMPGIRVGEPIELPFDAAGRLQLDFA